MLLRRHLAGNKNSQMADALVPTINDGLSCGYDLVLMGIEVGNPSQRLLRRRDAHRSGAEQDIRRLDVAQIDTNTAGSMQFARGQLVTDKEVVGNCRHL